MFPFNLHRNIAQLDKQISLLENECKDMELAKKWKNQKFEPTHSNCSRNSNVAIKPPAVRVNVKKSDNSKKIKKPTPPSSSRVRTTGSLPTRCSKNFNGSGDILLERKGKLGLSTKVPVGSCQYLKSESNLKTEKKCLCAYAVPVKDLGKEPLEPKRKDHVLRFPNAGGTIEVTVTQKPLVEGNSSKCHTMYSEQDVGNDSGSCRCHKGQKWSEILSLDSSRNQQSGSGSFVKNKILSFEAKKNSPQQKLNNSKQSEINTSQNEDSGIKEETFEIPVKLPSQFGKTKGESEINTNKFEKETQCSLEKCIRDSTKEFKNSNQIFQLLVKQFQNMPGENHSSLNATSYLKIKDPPKVEYEGNKFNVSTEISPETSPSYLNTMKHHFEILQKEKSVLTNDLEARDKTIATMKQRETEYLSLINSLKANLEKVKSNAQEGAETAKEINDLKNKFQDQMKASTSFKKRIFLLQNALEQCSLENEKLKTQVKILKLEAQKHEVLLAGKDAEIKKYREEIQNFQQQINEHLSTLKSNSQAVDVEKIMAAIMQQSQIFALTDLESLDREGKDSTKGQNILMHSSPTSTKTSEVNSSWKQISSIYNHDESKVESEVIFLNQDKNDKNFFEVFGGNSGCPKETKPENPQGKEDVKCSSSFTSCLSLREDYNRSNSTQDSITSRETTINEDEAEGELLRGDSGVCEDRVQSNIDELLKVMKLKFSREIFNNSFASYTTGDYLEMSQISSISPL